jgi:hypothetical protein
VEQEKTSIVNWNCAGALKDDVARHWRQGSKPTYRLATRTGRTIEATANHPFRTFTGWKSLKNLHPGSRIAVPKRLPVFGQGRLNHAEATLLGLMISDGQCRTPGGSPRYTSADPVLHAALDHSAQTLGFFTKAVGNYGRNITSRPHRGGIMRSNGMFRWLTSMGLAVTSKFKFVPDCVFEAPRPVVAQFLRSLFSGDGSAYHTPSSFFIEYGTISETLAHDVQHLLCRFGIVSFLDKRVSRLGYRSFRLTMTSKEEIAKFSREIGFIPKCSKWKTLQAMLALIASAPQKKSNFDTLPPEAWPAIVQACRKNGKSMNSLGFKPSWSQSVPRKLVSDLAQTLSDPSLDQLANSDILWDVVEKIEFAGVKPVFDLTMRGNSNFIANDLIVHNSTYARCGLVVNITPLEAEWEGHLTIEISNTTPLPAKIYANEGIAQVIFLGGDEVCQVSYKDRKGKYQGQKGIVLPRIMG